MGGASSWYTILAVTGFLTSVWLAGRVSKRIGMSSIVLEVAVGLILGPSVAGLIPKDISVCFEDRVTKCNDRVQQEKIAHKGTEFCDLAAYVKANKYIPKGSNEGFWLTQKSVELDGKTYCVDLNGCGGRRLEEQEPIDEGIAGGVGVRRLKSDKKGKTDFDNYSECLKSGCELEVAIKCATVPDIFTMVGHTGVAMMIFESGMHFDFDQAKVVGPWACAVAVLGTFLPLATGCALAVAYGFDFFPDGMSAGTSLAPTSVGIALRLLHEAKALNLYFGQAVMTAAFVDDVLSLILFSVLFSLGGDMTFMTFLPLILGCVFMVVAVIGAVTVWPPFMKFLFSKIPDVKTGKVSNHDQVMWLLMFVTLAAYAQITHLCGTHLWGCFIAGMCFSTQHHAHHVWVRQVKRITVWFMRVFFASTLAWSIPVKELFSVEAFWKGSIMGIGPCILTKVLCGPFMGDARWVIGWAMVGRAEFAYFIAIMAKALKMMEDKLFAILIWALIYATIFAPLVFSRVLIKYMDKLEAKNAPETGDVSLPTRTASTASMTQSAANAASSHLPDLVEEEEREKEKQRVSRLASLEEETADKDEEIKKLEDTVRQLQAKVEVLTNQVDASNKETEDAKNSAEPVTI